MKRIVFGVVAVAALTGALSLLFASGAWAHGGQFRGPGDSVPPGLREPSDPTPPPPPPPSGPPSTPAPVTPTPNTPSTPATETPTTAPPTTTPDTTQPNKGRQTPTSFEDWTFWYHNNNEDLENLKAALYNKLGTQNPLFQAGDSRGGGGTSGETRWTQKKVLEVVVPALLWAMDPANSGHQDTESASYIALAKVARDPAHIPTIMSGLDKAQKKSQIVQESAALGLGLLRRAEKENQFTARDLDKAREFLFKVFDDAEYPDRVRGFAMVSIGLLGDQPTGSGEYAGDRQAAEQATTTRLFELLKTKQSVEDLYVSIMMAIGLQSPTSPLPEQREVLGECALKGRLYKDDASDLVRAYAALALGRIGSRKEVGVLENILNAKRGVDLNTQRSAAIGLGLLGRLVSGEDRVRVANVLLRSNEKTKDNSTRNFGTISLAFLLIEDIRSRSTDVIGNTKANEFLLEETEKGNYLYKGFGSLALGLVLREISDELDIEAYQQFREAALTALRDGVSSKKMDKKTQAAFCTAVGIARDLKSREPLRLILADTNGDKILRSYAALGLGLIGDPNPEVAKSIADAMRERSSDELRRQAAVALGLLGNPKISGTGKDAVELLLEELKDAKSQSHKGQVVLALANVGDHRAVDELVRILKTTSGEQDLTRALACAGLGLIGDLELIPSLARGSKNINYRASTNMVDEFLSIL